MPQPLCLVVTNSTPEFPLFAKISSVPLFLLFPKSRLFGSLFRFPLSAIGSGNNTPPLTGEYLNKGAVGQSSNPFASLWEGGGPRSGGGREHTTKPANSHSLSFFTSRQKNSSLLEGAVQAVFYERLGFKTHSVPMWRDPRHTATLHFSRFTLHCNGKAVAPASLLADDI